MKGKFPDILSSPRYGTEAKKLYADAEQVLDELESNPAVRPMAVFQLFPASAVQDDIEIYTDAERSGVRARLYTLRQQAVKRRGIANLALADFVAPGW